MPLFAEIQLWGKDIFDAPWKDEIKGVGGSNIRPTVRILDMKLFIVYTLGRALDRVIMGNLKFI